MSDIRWWETFPWRMVQTNLREIDMADMDAKSYVDELKQYHATVVTLCCWYYCKLSDGSRATEAE